MTNNVVIADSQPDISNEDLHNQLEAEAEAADQAQTAGLLETPSSATQDGETSEKPTGDHAPDASADNKPKTTPDNPEPSADKRPEGNRDEQGRFKKSEEQQQQEAQGKDSSYKKAKETERLEKTWKNADAVKEANRVEADRLRKLADDIANLQRQQQQPQQQNSNEPRFDSRQYAAAAKRFKKEAVDLLNDGDIEGAKARLALAEESHAAAEHYARDEFTQHQTKQQEEFGASWRADAQAVIKEVPELGQLGTELQQQMSKLLEDFPALGWMPNGFRHAHEILTMRRDAADASGLREETKKQQLEIERLTAKLSPLSAKPSAGHSAPKGLDGMTFAQQHALLEREASMADAA